MSKFTVTIGNDIFAGARHSQKIADAVSCASFFAANGEVIEVINNLNGKISRFCKGALGTVKLGKNDAA